MNAPLRRVGVVVLILFGLLFANLNWVQGVRAKEYRTSDYNGRVLQSEYEVERGKVIVGGEAVAQSVPTSGELKYQRTYPKGAIYANLVGYKSVTLGATGIEKLENDYLNGNADSQIADRLSEMISGDKPGGNVVMSLSKAAQETAYNEIVNNKNKAQVAAAVAIDPKTGAILAAASIPGYDPNVVSTNDRNKAFDAQTALDKDANKPLLNRAFSERYPPGSTFKVVMSAAMLQNGLTPNSVIPAGPKYFPPETGGFFIKNASPNICPDPTITLIQALTQSCNTAFARYGAEQLGEQKIRDMAKKFGFDAGPPVIDRDDKNSCFRVAESTLGAMTNTPGKTDPAAIAQSSIGQSQVQMTPLQGALVAATVANNGSQMRPYLVQQLKGADLTTVHYTASPKELRRPISDAQARDIQTMMISVVNNGSGRNARISGFQVGGKTGTAENGEDENPHGWFIGFVMKNNEPIIATAVFLNQAGTGGSAEAARIGGQIMKAYIGEKGLA
jgi:peptidoglycan glycosyltransferase